MANNRFAFGLCKKYGIELPERATPYDAWKALKDRGYPTSDARNTPKIYRQNASYGEIRAEHEKMNERASSRKARISAVNKREWALWYNAISNLKTRYGDDYPDNIEFSIQIDDKAFVTRGTFEAPVLTDVMSLSDYPSISIAGDDEDDGS